MRYAMNGRETQIYLNNKDLLKEIHLSKTSYCEFTDKKYADYDIIVTEFEQINSEETIEAGKIARAERLTQVKIDEYVRANPSVTAKKAKNFVEPVDPNTIQKEDIVVRYMTFEHIPLDNTRKKKPRYISEYHKKVNFPPFKHYTINTDNTINLVGQSHYKNGEFNPSAGKITNKLALMFMLLVDRYSQRSNWRGYTYLDEMKGQALIQLSGMALQFNEHRSNNPFSYYTSFVSNSFTRVLNTEKKHQEIRDDLLQQNGHNPSFTRQLAHEEEIRRMRESSNLDNGFE